MNTWFKENDFTVARLPGLPYGHIQLYQKSKDHGYIKVPGITILIMDTKYINVPVGNINKDAADSIWLDLDIIPRDPDGPESLVVRLDHIKAAASERPGWGYTIQLITGYKFNLTIASYEKVVSMLKLFNMESKVIILEEIDLDAYRESKNILGGVTDDN